LRPACAVAYACLAGSAQPGISANGEKCLWAAVDNTQLEVRTGYRAAVFFGDIGNVRYLAQAVLSLPTLRRERSGGFTSARRHAFDVDVDGTSPRGQVRICFSERAVA
jgi:hypothetical protein